MLFSASHQRTAPSRVVVTGVGILTPFGAGWDLNAAGFRSGRVAIGPVTLFDVTRHRVKAAAQVPMEDAEQELTRAQRRRLERAAKMLLWAARGAWRQAGWCPSERLPLVLGTTSAGMTLGQDLYKQAIRSPSNRTQPSRVIHYQAQRQALEVAETLGFSGPITIIGNACASGANALGRAWELIRGGSAERVLAGGYDALSELVFSGFDSLQALSATQCRPFDAQRDGLALGEGAAVVALESMASAKARGAAILGEVLGYGAASDAHHLTQPHPEGDAAFLSMSGACRTAGIEPEQVQYINAHGTGTPLNDSSEAAAINRWAGAHAQHLSVSSTKASIGHLLGAAGAVEAVACLMALAGQWLPPTCTVRQPDPVCQFPLVREPRDAKLDLALTNSFGFGGANASLLLGRCS